MSGSSSMRRFRPRLPEDWDRTSSPRQWRGVRILGSTRTTGCFQIKTRCHGGFGNLIALPVQRAARKQDNTVFLDSAFVPWPDQWAFLASVRKIGRPQVEEIVADAERRGRILGVRLPPSDEGGTEPWTAPPSRRRETPIVGELPATLEVVLSNQIYIPKHGLNPGLRNRLVRLAAFQNPEFYRAQAMRLSTYDKPRVVACAEDLPHHIGQPAAATTT